MNLFNVMLLIALVFMLTMWLLKPSLKRADLSGILFNIAWVSLLFALGIKYSPSSGADDPRSVLFLWANTIVASVMGTIVGIVTALLFRWLARKVFSKNHLVTY